MRFSFDKIFNFVIRVKCIEILNLRDYFESEVSRYFHRSIWIIFRHYSVDKRVNDMRVSEDIQFFWFEQKVSIWWQIRTMNWNDSHWVWKNYRDETNVKSLCDHIFKESSYFDRNDHVTAEYCCFVVDIVDENIFRFENVIVNKHISFEIVD
jgi:hypothetical protein